MRKFGSTPETRAIAPASLQAAALGAILLASAFLLQGVLMETPYDFRFHAALALLALFAGFIFGGLATGLALMLVGVPVARFSEAFLDRPQGLAAGVAAAAICAAAFIALLSVDDLFWCLAAACFAFPAALLYRRQILLERVLERH